MFASREHALRCQKWSASETHKGIFNGQWLGTGARLVWSRAPTNFGTPSSHGTTTIGGVFLWVDCDVILFTVVSQAEGLLSTSSRPTLGLLCVGCHRRRSTPYSLGFCSTCRGQRRKRNQGIILSIFSLKLLVLFWKVVFMVCAHLCGRDICLETSWWVFWKSGVHGVRTNMRHG